MAQVEAYPEFKIFELLVQEPGIPTSEAVKRFLSISALAIASDEPLDLGNHLWHSAISIIEIAKRSPPDKHLRLIQCVVQLRGTQMMDPRTGKAATHDGQVVWRQLPTFGYTAADEWHAASELTTDSIATLFVDISTLYGWDLLDANLEVQDFNELGDRPDELQRWENFIALLAQLSNAEEVDYNDPVVSEMDFSFWSFGALHEVCNLVESGKTPSRVVVRTAAVWVQYAADRLWSNAINGRIYDRLNPDGGMKITEVMWKRWKQALSALITADNTDEGMVASITKALVEMERASS